MSASDVFAGMFDPPGSGGRDDPYWQTPEGARLMGQINVPEAARAEEASAKVSREIEQEARPSAQATQQAVWHAREAERKETEAREEAERVRADQERQTAYEAEAERARAARKAARAAAEKQDADYHVLQIEIDDWFSKAGDPEDDWMEGDDGEWFADNSEALRAEARAPWLVHYRKMGLIRADNLVSTLTDGHVENSATPKFYLIFRAEDAASLPASLGEFPPTVLPLNNLSGGELEISGAVRPVNATRLYSAIRAECGASADPQDDEATPEPFPQEGESRDDWLMRVCMPTDQLDRAVARWERCGGDPELFALTDSVSDQPIEWVVPGLIPRGYVALLVGDSMAGKSTLLSEMAAVIDSQSQAPRTVLGAEITVRGVSAIVTGEDGPNIVGARAKVYEAVHGAQQSYVFDLAACPWPKALELLHRIPVLDFVCIDPLRALFDGDEDASGNISRVFNELNALARAKNCAVVLAHHLGKKGARSLSQVAQAVRGSGVVTQRPRISIAMFDRGSGVVEVGIFNHNFPPSEEMWGDVGIGRRFRRDAETMTLVPVDASPAPKDAASSAGVLDQIVEAVRHYNGLNVALRRTGKNELFERKAPQLVGMSRGVIREGVATLLAAGRLVDGPEGLSVADDQFPAAPTGQSDV